MAGPSLPTRAINKHSPARPRGGSVTPPAFLDTGKGKRRPLATESNESDAAASSRGRGVHDSLPISVDKGKGKGILVDKGKGKGILVDKGKGKGILVDKGKGKGILVDKGKGKGILVDKGKGKGILVDKGKGRVSHAPSDPPSRRGLGFRGRNDEAKVDNFCEKCGEGCDRTIYVSNLPPSLDNNEVKELFRDFGQHAKVEHRRIMDPENMRVEATIVFKVASSAHAAAMFYNDHDLKGFRISVSHGLSAPTYVEGTGLDFKLPPLGFAVKEPFLLRNEVSSKLMPYQIDALKWLWKIHCTGKGGLLADDMGLGKTRQILAFVAGLLQSKLIPRALIAVPRTLMDQWLKEIVNVTGLQDFTYVFDPQTRKFELDNVRKHGGILLTTHRLASNHWQTLNINWQYLILDEAHNIHKSTLITYQNLEMIRCDHRILLTGTPAPNNLKELRVLLEFCSPGLFNSVKEFKDTYLAPLVDGNYKGSSKKQLERSMRASVDLQNLIRPCFLRRLKDVLSSPETPEDKRLSLPEKTDITIWLKLSPYQEQLYRTLLGGKIIDKNKERQPFVVATLLQKICNHPKNLKQVNQNADKDENQEWDLDIGERFRLRSLIAKLINSMPKIEDDNMEDNHSCKLDIILKLLERFKVQDHRALIFSRTCEMLDVIEGVLARKGFVFDRIDGTLTPKERARRIKAFKENDETRIFLISSLCGGTGLDLHVASRAIIVEPFWNPSIDDQCADRIYRINQQKECIIYRLVSSETIEEQVYKRQVFKLGIFKSATETKNFKRYITKELHNTLFELPPNGFGSSRTLQQILEYGQTETLSSKATDEMKFLKNDDIVGLSIHNKLFSETLTRSSNEIGTSNPRSELDWAPQNDENLQRSRTLASLESGVQKFDFEHERMHHMLNDRGQNIRRLRDGHMEEITKLRSNAIDKT